MKVLDEKIAELIGMHVGDGTLYKTNWCFVWELRGSLNEKDYYVNHVSNLLQPIVNIEFTPKFRSGGKNGCFGIQTSKKEVTSLFLELGFNPGRKTHTVRIPDYIKNSNRTTKLAFLRGYFDTDGCLRFERINKRKVHEYPHIEFSTFSKALKEDLLVLLFEMGFRATTWGRAEFKVRLSVKDNLRKFMDEVSPSNKKHLNKHQFWNKHGYYDAEVA